MTPESRDTMTLPEDNSKSRLRRMRAAWMNGEKTTHRLPHRRRTFYLRLTESYSTKRNSRPMRVFKKHGTKGQDQFPDKSPCGKRPHRKCKTSPMLFEELDGLVLNGNLFATVFPPGYILFSWKTDLKMPPPEIYIRDCGSAWITSSDWKEMDRRKSNGSLQQPFLNPAKSLVLRIGETECLLEVLLLPSRKYRPKNHRCHWPYFEAFEEGRI